MIDFDELYNDLYSSLKNEYLIMSFSYSKKNFDVVLANGDLRKVTTADIVIFNHKTKQYRVFKYVSGNTDTVMIFKCEDITLTIREQENLMFQYD